MESFEASDAEASPVLSWTILVKYSSSSITGAGRKRRPLLFLISVIISDLHSSLMLKWYVMGGLYSLLTNQGTVSMIPLRSCFPSQACFNIPLIMPPHSLLYTERSKVRIQNQTAKLEAETAESIITA